MGSAWMGTWEEWFVILSQQHPFRGDMLHPGWSAATFSGPRCLDNVVSVAALVLDYDDGTTLEAAQAVWTWSGLCRTTRRHTAQKPRFRVVLPLTRSVTVGEYAKLWGWAMERAQDSGQAIDGHAKDASRFWFMPGGDEHGCIVLDGELLDPDWLLAELEEAVDARPQPKRRK